MRLESGVLNMQIGNKKGITKTIHNMKKKTYGFLLIIIILASSCHKYKNKTHYELKLGETFELYIDENSCCQNCFINKSSIKTIELISDKVVDPGRKNCIGCSWIIAWTFKAKKIGTDTIKIQRLTMPEKCDSSSTRPIITYIITVK